MSSRKMLLMPARLTAAVLAGLLVPGWALAQTAQPVEEEQPADARTEVQDMDRVSVTGSRIARANVEGPAPVVVITADDIEKQGFTTIWESLGTLTQFTGLVTNETDTTGTQAPNGQFVNLRGLGPGYQLILLNGRRIADYPAVYGTNNNAVSTGSIPAAAVERIEVMSGGASAIYGSDAVAGVINIITKTSYDGHSVRLRGGTTSQGGGDTGLLQYVGGTSGDRWNLLWTLEHLAREEIIAEQRGLTYWADPRFQTPAGDTPTWILTGVGYWATANSSVYLWPDGSGDYSSSHEAMLYACNRANPDYVPFYSSSTLDLPNRCGNFDYYNGRSLQNSYNKTSGYLSGTFDFSDNLHGYAQALFNKSDDKSAAQTHYYMGGDIFTHFSQERGEVMSGQRALTISEAGMTYIRSDETAWNLNFGLQGTMFSGRFDWDAGVTLSRFKMTSSMPRFLRDQSRDYFLGPVLGYVDGEGAVDGRDFSNQIRELNPDRMFAPVTPDIYDQITTLVVNRGESENDSFQFVFSGPLFDLPAGSVEMAAVLEASRAEYYLRPDPRVVEGYIGPEKIYNLGRTPGGGPRERYAAGLEFRVPLLSTLEATVAGRFDQYEDTGLDSALRSSKDAVTWQAGLEWRPTNNFLARASHATSFRAPDLMWIYAGEVIGYPYIYDEYFCRRDGIDPLSSECQNMSTDYYYQPSQARVSAASPLLEPETGKSTTIGFVWDVLPNLSATVDYYQIELEDRVRLIPDAVTFEREADCRLGQDRQGNPVDSNSTECNFYTSYYVERPVGEHNPLGRITRWRSFPINASIMKTTGVDTSMRYHHDFGRWGVLGAQLGYTHVFSFETADFADSPLVDSRNELAYNPVRWRANMRLNWAYDEWNTSLYAYTQGGIPNFNQATNPGRGPSHTIWNMDVSKEIVENLRLGLSVTNLFDKMPPSDPSYTSWPYFRQLTHSAIGRQAFFNVSYDF